MTRVELQLLTDPDMYLFIEDGLTGKISMISKRYGRTINKPYLAGYDKNQETNYTMYLDANKLYG